ncbi:AAA family ATPase [Peptoniphilus sp.]|uniref:AAA family ATPase n=1 Tax=Peptoniphilus sp. TaxID=1971214 RepID=UPI0039916C29
MATINQVKELLKAHFGGDSDKFKVIALQIAAHEAKVGHTNSAREIKALVENSPSKKNNVIKFNNSNKSLELKYSDTGIEELVVSNSLKSKIDRIISEYKKRDVLLKNGLKNRSKLLLEGNPGTGKTMTASVIAYELGLPLYSIQIHHLISKYMGETSVKLKKIFDQIREYRGVYLFDEFDAIGSDRSFDNDVGEMRRILNSFLQYIEEDDSASIIICATNNPNMLDKALFRRFDDVFEYELPDKEQIVRLIEINLYSLDFKNIITEKVIKSSLGLSHADIVKVCKEAKKHVLLNDKKIDEAILLDFIKERKQFLQYKEVSQ